MADHGLSHHSCTRKSSSRRTFRGVTVTVVVVVVVVVGGGGGGGGGAGCLLYLNGLPLLSKLDCYCQSLPLLLLPLILLPLILLPFLLPYDQDFGFLELPLDDVDQILATPRK